MSNLRLNAWQGLLALSLLTFVLVLSCGKDEAPEEPEITFCAEYPNWENSDYVLPYPVGVESRISQGNCTIHSHQGTLRFSYDFEMPFGSVVTAVRDGVVLAIRVSQPEGARGLSASNWLQVRHSDGMVSEYVHLAQHSSRVSVGQRVVAGDTLALTGDTGDVGTWPHLHFDINRCANNLACDTEPVTFHNTSPNPNGLILNQVYEAFRY